MKGEEYQITRSILKIKAIFKLAFLLCLLSYGLSFGQNIPESPNLSNENGRQGEWTILFDESWSVIQDKENATYYRIINYLNDKPQGTVKDFYFNGQLQMTAELTQDRPFEVYNNKRVIYNESGEIQQVEVYDNGKLDFDKTISALKEYQDQYTGVLFSLGSLYLQYRYRDLAIFYFEKLSTIINEKEGDDSFEYAKAIKNLAWVYLRHNDYIKAEPLFFEAKAIIEKYQERDMILYGEILSDMGDLFNNMSRYEEAINYLERAQIVIQENASATDFHRTIILNNLALSKIGIGEYSEAINLLKIAKKDAYDRFGRNNRETANITANLAKAYIKTNDFNEAKLLLEEATSILQDLYGSNQKEYLDRYYELATVYEKLGDIERAASIYLEVSNKYAEQFDIKNTEAIRIKRAYGKALFRLDKKNDAIPILRSTFADLENNLHRYFHFVSEEVREKLYAKHVDDVNFQTSLTLANYQEFPELVDDLMNTLLRNKALLLNTTSAIRNRILESNDRKLLELFNEAQELRQKLGEFSSLSNEDVLKNYNIDRDSLIEVFEKKDFELNRLSSIYQTSNEPPKWENLEEKLNPNEALVELHRYEAFDVLNWQQSDSASYLALVLRSNSSPKIVELPNSKTFETSAFSYYSNNILFKLDDNESYKTFWEPISRKLKRVKKVYLSADGIYHKLNLNTLRNAKTGSFVIDEIDIELITSGRDLLEQRREPLNLKMALLIGNPNFGEPPTELTKLNDQDTSNLKNKTRKGFGQLPGTYEEVKIINGLLERRGWNSQLLVGNDADEYSVKEMLRPNILHFATHGFFYETNQSMKSDPLSQSGLLLKGANANLYGKKNRNEANNEDGILTAYEALNLNIDNTDLVVLSACETGLGVIKNGEGVYGLQRAFKVAGARTIIMSLWRVDDTATKNQMSDFYTNWLEKGMSKRAAFKQAQLTAKKKYKHPYYWGAFLLVGE